METRIRRPVKCKQKTTTLVLALDLKLHIRCLVLDEHPPSLSLTHRQYPNPELKTPTDPLAVCNPEFHSLCDKPVLWSLRHPMKIRQSSPSACEVQALRPDGMTSMRLMCGELPPEASRGHQAIPGVYEVGMEGHQKDLRVDL